MSIAHLTQDERNKLKAHGHPDMWELTTYGRNPPDSVVVECTRCGEVLLELVLDDSAENRHDHMNAHSHADGTTGYYEHCDDYCKQDAAQRKTK
jgi:hypothetical protein